MNWFGSQMYYIFVALCGAVLTLLVRPQKVSGVHLSQDAPTEFVPMPNMQTSATAVALDPRIDISSDVSHDPVIEEESTEPTEATTESSESTVTTKLNVESAAQ